MFHEDALDFFASLGLNSSGALVTYTLSPPRTADGQRADLPVMTGRVVASEGGWLALKLKDGAHLVAHGSLLGASLAVGQRAAIRPYARRQFAATAGSSQGLGRLPVDRGSLKDARLARLVALIEAAQAPDGWRSLVDALAGFSRNGAPVGALDPHPRDCLALRPSLQFRVTTAIHDGYLNIRVEDNQFGDGDDTYEVQVTCPNTGELRWSAIGVSAQDLPVVVCGMVDDGAWRIAHVEVHQPTRRPSAAALTP